MTSPSSSVQQVATAWALALLLRQRLLGAASVPHASCSCVLASVVQQACTGSTLCGSGGVLPNLSWLNIRRLAPQMLLVCVGNGLRMSCRDGSGQGRGLLKAEGESNRCTCWPQRMADGSGLRQART